jgi:uncharacterized protein (DUF1697 family)
MSEPRQTRWVALLRGVNVGGVTVKSKPLAELFSGPLGFANVKTVLATGNVAFDAGPPSERAELKARIEAALSGAFGYEAWIVLLTQQELCTAAEGYPFSRTDETHQPYLLFGSQEQVLDELAAAIAEARSTEDETARALGVLYWKLPKGRSVDTPVAKLVAKAKYKSTTTNRNLRTVEKLTIA